jgi:SAM-dependent methyltransferase
MYQRRTVVSELQEELRRLIPNAASRDVVRILDSGAGPLSAVGTVWPGVNLQVTAADALGVQYAQLNAKYGIKPPVVTVTADFEEVDNVFPPNHFDLVHVSNALDHAYDPLSGIIAMLTVLKPGGVLYMEHGLREGEFEHYDGMHQWNFEQSADGKFVMWQQTSARIVVNDEVADMVDRIDIRMVENHKVHKQTVIVVEMYKR